MYAKVFKQIYNGTLATVGPWQALVTFQQLLILADAHGVVDMTPEAISRQTTIPLEIITTGIAALEQPDPDSRTPDEEGRRILRLAENRTWGWRVTNYEHYRQLKREEDRTEYHRQYWHSTRKAKLNATQQDSTNQPIAEAEAEANTEGSKTKSGQQTGPVAIIDRFDEFQNLYPKRLGSQRWPTARRHAAKRLKEGITWEQMLEAAARYKYHVTATGELGTKYVQQAATFLGDGGGYAEPWELPKKPETALERIHRLNNTTGSTIDHDPKQDVPALVAPSGDVRR